MKKHLIASLLVLSLLLIMLPVKAAPNEVFFDVVIPSKMPKAGDRFEVAVEISNNSGFCAIQFELSYDSTIMECDDVITDGVLMGALSVTNAKAKEGAIVAAVSLKALAGDGVVARYTFTAKEDITDYGFQIKNIVLIDESNNDIPYEVADGVKDTEASLIPEDSGETESPGLSGTGNEETVVEHIFPDAVGHWAESFINEATKRGFFQGETDGNFYPDDHVTRGQFVTVLWRMAGKPDVSTEAPFVDTQDQIPEFQSAIAWGYSNGCIHGTSDTTFEPNGMLTREAGMKILHDYSGGKSGMETMFTSIYDGIFEDSHDISQWAKPSVYWGIYNELILGMSPTTLAPKTPLTRAQLAKILLHYDHLE